LNDDATDDPPRSAFTSADPPRNFTLRLDERIRALTIGVPAYAARKKKIEDLEARLVATLVTLHDALAARQAKLGQQRDDLALASAVADKAETLDLKQLNALIETHNRYYPMEANLPIDLPTGEYLVSGRRWLPESPWSAERLVARVRAVLDARADR
jgi:hypothetical protein